jgi:hypothetical protein
VRLGSGPLPEVAEIVVGDHPRVGRHHPEQPAVHGEQPVLGQREPGQLGRPVPVGAGAGHLPGQRRGQHPGPVAVALHDRLGTGLPPGRVEPVHEPADPLQGDQPLPGVHQVVPQRRRGVPGELGGDARRAGEHVRPGDRDGKLGSRRRLGRQVVRGAQVLEAGRAVHPRLQQAERTQHVEPGRTLGRLREGAAQVRDRALGGPAGGRGPGRGAEHVDAAGVAPAGREQQVRADLLGRPAAQPQQARGPLVGQGALRARHRPVDGIPDQRVDEPDRVLVAQDLRPGQVREGGRGRGLVEAGHLGIDGRSARSPSTATAPATAVASSGSRRSRVSTMLATAREPQAMTRSAWAASGRTRSASSARSSWRSSSGLPAVVVWQAARNSGAGSPSRRRTSSAVPSRLSGPGRTPPWTGRGGPRPAGRRPRAARRSARSPAAAAGARRGGGTGTRRTAARRCRTTAGRRSPAPAAARRRGRRPASRGHAGRRTSPRPAGPARRTRRARWPPRC